MVLLYWLLVSRRRATVCRFIKPVGGASGRNSMALAISAGVKAAKWVTHSRSEVSSAEPGRIRCPPAWRTRLVGLARIKD